MIFFLNFRLGESCSHAAALLFKIEAAVRLGMKKTACTDEACAWNRCCLKKVEPERIARVSFFSPKSSTSKRPPQTPSQTPTSLEDAQKQNNFINLLAASPSPSPVVLSTYKEFVNRFKLQPQQAPVQMPPVMKELAALQQLRITKEQQDFVERSTRAQSSTPVWHEQRIGRITASISHSVMRTDIESPAPSIVSTIISPSSRPLRVPAIEWGN
jgi:hypothetical protein